MRHFLATKKRYLLSTALLTTVGMLLLLPIKRTPIVTIISEYPTWHEVSTLHLMKVLWKANPEGVTAIGNCTSWTDPVIRRKDIESVTGVKHYDYQKALEQIEDIMEVKGLGPDKDLTVFSPIMDKKTKITLLHTYSVMAEALTRANVSFMLLHGSLLGIHRFGGISPWDDDIDVGISVKHWKVVRDTLSCIKGFEMFVDPLMRWAFFPSDGVHTNSIPEKRYPFIDIFFQEEDESHVWGLHKVNRRRSLFPKDKIFPRKWAYLEGIKVPVPNDSYDLIKLQYGDLSWCQSQDHGHLVPKIVLVRIPCSMLHPVYGDFSKRQHS